MEISIDWEPQPRQLVLLDATGLSFPFTDSLEHQAIADIFGYGGSAGGGKTDSLISISNVAAFRFPRINIGYFRREFPQLEGLGGAIQRSKELLSGFCKWDGRNHRWSYPTQALLQFCHCQNPDDVFNYQSQQFDILLVDEATQFTEEMIDYLVTRNRKTISDPLFKPFTVLATNPGNVGHTWFKERMNPGDPSKHEKPQDFIYPTGVKRTHFFIPSKLSDNQILEHRDPTYRDRIATNELNKRMLLEGDWDVFQGQAFSELRMDKHLIDPYEIYSHRTLFAAYDHGFNHPFSFGVFAIDQDGNIDLVRHLTGRLLRPDEIARQIKELVKLERLDYIVAGLDCWTKQRDGGPSVEEQFRNQGVNLRRAKVDRVQGAQQLRNFLAWKNKKKTSDGFADGEPRFHIFNSCSSVYSTLARMIFDPNQPEDVLKVDAVEGKGGDDEYDMVRYGLMSRPQSFVPAHPKKTAREEIIGWIEEEKYTRRLQAEL